YPETRGRMATEFTASRRPVNSSHSVTSRETTSATLIFGGGGVPAGCAETRAQACSSGERSKRAIDVAFISHKVSVPRCHETIGRWCIESLMRKGEGGLVLSDDPTDASRLLFGVIGTAQVF